MTDMEKGALLEQLANNDEFTSAIANAQSKQELQNVFAANGLEMTQEEVDGFIATMKAMGTDELDECDLEGVAGGAAAETVLGWMWNGAKMVAKKAWDLGKKFANWENSL